MKAATRVGHDANQQSVISIHAAREGGDGTVWKPCTKATLFQSTPPVKAATGTNVEYGEIVEISIHAAREGGDSSGDAAPGSHDISIHAAREGGDLKNADLRFANLISIHAAREGGDATGKYRLPAVHGFQSTPPVKAATP